MSGLKRITGLFTAIFMIIISVLPNAAASGSEAEQIAALIPDIIHTSNNMTVNPGSVFDFWLSFDRANAKDIEKMSFEITSYGDFSMVEGNETVNKAELSKIYYYKFAVPENPASSTVYIRYTVYFEYNNKNGNLISESKNFFSKIDIKGMSDNSTGSVSIENVTAADVNPGSAPVINAQLVNTWQYTLTDAVLQVLNDKGTVIARKYIGKIASLSDSAAYDMSLTLPAYETAGNKALTLRLDYKNKDGNSQSATAKYTLTVSEDEPLSLRNFTPPAKITSGNPAEFNFNLINKGDVEYKNAQIYFYKGENLIHTEYIGLVPAQQQTGVKFSYTFNSTGSDVYKTVVNYENAAGKKMTVQHSQKLTVYANSPLEINNIAVPENPTTKTITEIKFNLINKSDVDFTNAEAFLYKGNTLLENAYIGAVSAQSQISSVISHKFETVGKDKYILKINYNDASGKLNNIKNDFELDIIPFEGTDNEAGALKIQTIVPPVEALINSTASFMFAITNPTSNSVKGVEVFVLDEKGSQLNSIYISEIGPNSSYSPSPSENMSFNTAKTEGVHSYTLRVLYKDSDEKEYTLSKSFSVNTVLEKKEETDSYPANLKIQKIENPSAMYTNVKTDIPVTIVNAGKGTAYNVELYVLNTDGQELAREYIGTVTAAGKAEASYKVKYLLAGEYDAVLYVTYENADDTAATTQKPYSQQVIDYRASITDIAGYEWLEMGYQYNIEFSIINNGTEKLLNTNAVLTGGDGTKYAELYIGTIDPGTKKERQRFRNVIFNTPGALELTITVTYENSDMQVFEFKNEVSANVSEPYIPEMNMDMGNGEIAVDADGMPIDGVIEGGGIEWWVLALIIGGGVIIAGTIIIIIIVKVRKKGKKKNDDDDIEYFLKQLSHEKSEDKENNS